MLALIATLVLLRGPMSTAVLSPLQVSAPRHTAIVRRSDSVTTVTYRSDPFVPEQKKDAHNALDTSRGFDVAVDTVGAGINKITPAHFRYVVTWGYDFQHDNVESAIGYIVYLWGEGDSSATYGATLCDCARQAAFWPLDLDAGDHKLVTLKVEPAGGGRVKILGITRARTKP